MAAGTFGCAEDTPDRDPEPGREPAVTSPDFEPAHDPQGDLELGFDPGTDPTDVPSDGQIECGAHASARGDRCTCDDGYTWCSGDAGDTDCCADAGSSGKPPLAPEDVTGFAVIGVRIRPFAFLDGDGEPVPWDWDGNVPDWILEAVGLLATVFPELRAWSEVLEKVDEYAPFLLEGTTRTSNSPRSPRTVSSCWRFGTRTR